MKNKLQNFLTKNQFEISRVTINKYFGNDLPGGIRIGIIGIEIFDENRENHKLLLSNRKMC